MANIPGTNGNDDLMGTAGDDTITPLDNPQNDGADRIEGSTGNDIIDFSSAANGFFELLYDNLSAGIIVAIDTSIANGTVDKGANGFDTLLDVFRALNEPAGMYFNGTDFDDVFNISVNDGDYFHYRADKGVDAHNLTINEGGTIRMDFRGGFQGININLGTQTISDDGSGNSESLSLTNNGGRLQIQATDFSDTIVGSAGDEDFILNSGNDTVDGGDGSDSLRFDRSGMDSVTVNLAAGTATGMFEGVAFSHTFTNIENVRGARDSDDNDTILGNSEDNRLEGRGGNDVIKGRGGDDRLEGDEGDDMLFGGTGDDDLEGGDGNDELTGGSGNNYLEGGDGDDILDASGTDADGFGDYIRPGAGANTIIGSQALWDNDEGIDIAYDDVTGSGGLNITVGANGNGTTVSNVAGVVNDTFTYTHYFIGSHDDDTFIGNDEDRFEGWRGNAGDDMIDGRGGFDRLDYYWEARDNDTATAVTVNFGTGISTDSYGDTDTFFNIEGVEGTSMGDTFIGKDGADYITFRGLEGADVIIGTATGYEDIDYSRDADRGGDAGIDVDLVNGTVVDGFGDTDTVSNIDSVRGTRFDDVMVGSDADEVFRDGDGDDNITAGDGDDRLHTGRGADFFDGGDGRDEIIIDVSSAQEDAFTYSFNMVTGEAGAPEFPDFADTYINVEDVYFYGHIDVTLTGSSGTNAIHLSDGDDRVFAGKGSDYVELGAGDDYVKVGGGKEQFYGGAGKDFISYFDSPNGVTLNLATNFATDGWAGNDIVEGFESAAGSKTGDDTITGTDGSNTIKTFGGNDRVYSGAGKDVVELGSGDDFVQAGGGTESFDGGSGKDYISYAGSANGVEIDLAADTISGGWGNNDTIKSFEGAAGSATGDDKLLGDGGVNTLRGLGGNDDLNGRGGSDRLFGGSGDDRLDGGKGTDQLYGGGGEDRFHFDMGDGTDTIKDFQNNTDTIELDNFTFAPGEDAFDFADQVGSDVVFTFDTGDVLIVEDTNIGALGNDLILV